MGKLRNEDGLTINEITLSIRALRNSPHDAVTFDPGNGIRGVNIDGRVFSKSEDTVIRSVNITFDGVSVECNTDFLMMLSDEAFRKDFVAKTKASHAQKVSNEVNPHDWQHAAKEEAENPGFLAWQCSKCKQWTSIKIAGQGATEYAIEVDAGRGPLGCPGVPVAEGATGKAIEKAADNIAAAQAKRERRARKAKAAN